MPPVIFAGGQAFTVQGQYAIPAPDVSIASLHVTMVTNLPTNTHSLCLKTSVPF